MLDLGDCGWGSALSASMEEPPLLNTVLGQTSTGLGNKSGYDLAIEVARS